MSSTKNSSNKKKKEGVLKSVVTPMAPSKSPRSVVEAAVTDVANPIHTEEATTSRRRRERECYPSRSSSIERSRALSPDSGDRAKENPTVPPSRQGSRPNSLKSFSKGSRRSLIDNNPTVVPTRQGSRRNLLQQSSQSPTRQGSRRSIKENPTSPTRQGSRRNLLKSSQSPSRGGSRRSLLHDNPAVPTRQGSRRNLSKSSQFASQGSRRSLIDNDNDQPQQQQLEPELTKQRSRRSLMAKSGSLRKLVNKALPTTRAEGTNMRQGLTKSKSKSSRVLMNDMETPLSQSPKVLKKSKSDSYLHMLGFNSSTNSLVKSASGLLNSSVGLATNTAKDGANFFQSRVNSSVEFVQSGLDAGARQLEGGMSTLTGLGTSSRAIHLAGNSPLNEMTIYSSDVYSVDYVLREFKKAKKDQVVDSLVVEDLLVRGDKELNQAAVSLIKRTAMVPNDQANLEDETEKALLELNVHVIAGEELAVCDTDMIGRETSSDPYVIVSLVSDDQQQEFQVGRTVHCSQTVNPTWNINISKIIPQESFATRGKSFVIQLKIMDFDIVGNDDCMGIVQIPIKLSRRSLKKKIAPKWYVVPAKSAQKASGRIQVAVDTKCCYREVLPLTKYERHWKKFTFYDNIENAKDYERYKENKAQIQEKIRKVLKSKGIKKMPIKFQAKVEAKMLNLHEMLELLGTIEHDQAILSLDFPGYNHTSSKFMDGGYSVHKDIKRLPGTLSSKFDPMTLEWIENADPVVINIKYGSKPQSKKEDKMKKKNPRTSMVKACSLRLLEYSPMDDSRGSCD